MRVTNKNKDIRALHQHRVIAAFIIMLLIVGSTVGTCPRIAHALNITRDNYLVGMGSTTKSKAKALAKKVGAKTKRSKSYPTFYASGNKMAIGVNANAHWPNSYVYIRNTGNKKVSLLGVKIGMTKTQVKKALAKQNYRTYDKGKTYMFGNAERIKLTYKSGKVSAYTYTCTPSC